jgi:hypothetical protein
MMAGAQRGRSRRRGTASGSVLSLDRLRIERGLDARTRYRYVQPRVEADGAGWKVLSPNCSRSVAPDGGEIPIAWFEPCADGHWRLHARDHAAQAWVLRGEGLSLTDALAQLCADPLGEFWP